MDSPTTIIEEVTDPEEIARFRERRERHRLNEDVFCRYLRQHPDACRGKVVVVAGRELHAADTAEEAWTWARERHPEDDTPLVQYVPKERGWRIYANRRRVARVQ